MHPGQTTPLVYAASDGPLGNLYQSYSRVRQQSFMDLVSLLDPLDLSLGRNEVVGADLRAVRPDTRSVPTPCFKLRRISHIE
jgi:hypothetical protein